MGRKPSHARHRSGAAEERAALVVDYSDGELAKMHGRPPFSFLSAVKYVTILSILLWWLPTFGQMIAGYVGGRRAGSPWRGVAAALVPVLLIFVGLYVVDQGILGDPAGIRALPSAAAGAATAVPVLGPYFQFAIDYTLAFLSQVRSLAAYSLSGYLITLVFAYIGGIFADQARRELDARGGSRMGIAITQPILSALPKRKPRPATHFGRLRKVPATAVAGREDAPAEDEGDDDASGAEAAAEDAAEDAEEPEARGPPPGKGGKGKTEKYVTKALRRYDRPSRAAR